MAQINDYSKRLKRLPRDTRHKEELATLEIKYQFEENLGEEFRETPNEIIIELVQRVLPSGPQLLTYGLAEAPLINAPELWNSAFRGQAVRKLAGVVAHHVIGDENLSLEAAHLAKYISEHSNEHDKGALLQALRELDDEAAPRADRMK